MVFNVTWLLRNHLNVLMCCCKLTEYFLLLKKVVLHNMDHDVFFQDSLMNRKFKRTAFLTRNLTVVVVVYRSLRIWMKSQPGTSSPWLHSHEICSATSTSRSAMEVIGRCVNIFRTHTFPFLFILISTLFRDKMATINFTIVHLSFLAFVQKMEEHLVRTKKRSRHSSPTTFQLVETCQANFCWVTSLEGSQGNTHYPTKQGTTLIYSMHL